MKLAKGSSVEINVLKQLEQKGKKCTINGDTNYSNLLQRIGAIYFNMENFTLAEYYTLRSIEGYRKKYPYINGERLVKSFFNLAMVYLTTDNHDKSFSVFDSCLYYAETFKAHTYQIDSYKNIALLHYFKGDFQQSVLYAERGEQVARSIKDTISESILMGEKALYLLYVKMFDRALVAAKNALALHFSTLNNRNLHNDAFIYTMYAEVSRVHSGFRDAINYYKKAFDLYTALEYKHEQFVCLNNIGDIYFDDLQNPDISLSYFQKALKYAEDSYDSSLAYCNAGEVVSYKQQYTIALTFYKKALAILPGRPEADDRAEIPIFENLKTVSRKESIVIVLVDRAQTRMNQFKQNGDTKYLDKAMKCYLLADSIIDYMLSKQELPASKVLWREKTHALYEAAIEICLIRKNMAEAFYFFEKSRAFVLSEQLGKNDWLMEKNSKLLTLQTRSIKQILGLEQNLKNVEYNENEKEMIENKLFQSKMFLDSLNKLINTNSYSRSNSIPSLGQMVEQLDSNTGLFELFIGDSAVYILYIQKKSTRLRKISRLDFNLLVSNYTRFCNTPGAINTNYKDFVKVASDLFNLLFDQLTLNVNRLIISPDGQFFPFESLINKQGSGEVIYMVNEYAISYTFSAKMLLGKTKNNGKRLNSFLGIAPVTFDGSTKLESLLKSDHSLKLISERFSSSSVQASLKATKKNFLDNFYKYEIVQLYTHAAQKSDNNEPVIYFADSCVYLSELLVDKRVATKFIFLSGCETGAGKTYKGEGVFSLGRGFVALGIPSTVTTLWKVENQSMYRITEQFYKHLAKGLPKDIALQKAKVDFIKSSDLNSLPYYWAAPVLIGNTDPLMMTDKEQNIWMLVLFILSAAFMAFIAFKLLKKHA